MRWDNGVHCLEQKLLKKQLFKLPFNVGAASVGLLPETILFSLLIRFATQKSVILKFTFRLLITKWFCFGAAALG